MSKKNSIQKCARNSRDLTGQKFHKLTALKKVATDNSGHAMWLCLCECGNEITTRACRLKSGHTKSCGCLTNLKDLTNKKFGRLTVIKIDGYDNNGRPRWLCKCECGTLKTIYGAHLVSGDIQSCGCLKKEVWLDKNFKHGESQTKEYKAWKNARLRCFNIKDKNYKNYGARGITMCLRWANDFNEFLKDMGRCPKGYTLDRIDNDGNYDPENCRWASYYEQSRNKRNNHWIEYNGENLILTDWAKKIRIPPKTLHSKLKTMTMEEIIKSLSNSSQSKGGTV